MSGFEGGIGGLVGSRVALRHRVGDRDGRPLYSDAVGELERGGPDELIVHTRRGPVHVRADAVVVVRAVPPPVPRRPSWAAVAALEGVCARAWPAMVERQLGAWRLRAADGFTRLANSTLATGDPGMSYPAALGVARDFATAHGIPALARVPVGSPWETALDAAGWAGDHTGGEPQVAEVLVIELAGLDTGPEPEGSTSFGGPDARWWQVVTGATPPTPAQRRVLTGVSPVGFGHLDEVALRAAVVGEHLHLALFGGAAAPAGGLAAAVQWGRDLGARWGVLQVDPDDEAARAGSLAQGFRAHHRVRYVSPAPG